MPPRVPAVRLHLRAGLGVVRHTVRRLARRRCVVSAGDSHAGVAHGRAGDTFVASLGPVTMHRAGRPGELRALLDGWVRARRPGWAAVGAAACARNDVLLLHFGEIDVRCHIADHLDEEEGAQGTVGALALGLVRAAEGIRSDLGCQVVVCAVVPTSVQVDDPSFPYRGSVEERVRWTRMLNAALQEACAGTGVEYLGAAEQFAGADGTMRADASGDGIHVAAHARPRFWAELDRLLGSGPGTVAGAGLVPTAVPSLFRTRLRAGRRQLRLVLRHPSNRGQRLRRLVGVVRYEVGTATGRQVTAPFADRSRVRVVKGGNSSSRAVFARLPDWPEMRIWQAVLQPGDRFVDVGANVGLYTLLAAERGCDVIAVEPATDMAAMLRANTRMNGVTAEVREVALLDGPGRVSLVGADANRRRAVRGGADDHPGAVVASSLDELLGGRSARGVKIDVEGNERLVLEGGPHVLRDPALELLQLEWNDTSVGALGEDRLPVARLLRAAGFTLYRATADGTLRRLEEDNPPFGSDVFAARGTAEQLLASFDGRA